MAHALRPQKRAGRCNTVSGESHTVGKCREAGQGGRATTGRRGERVEESVGRWEEKKAGSPCVLGLLPGGSGGSKLHVLLTAYCLWAGSSCRYGILPARLPSAPFASQERASRPCTAREQPDKKACVRHHRCSVEAYLGTYIASSEFCGRCPSPHPVTLPHTLSQAGGRGTRKASPSIVALDVPSRRPIGCNARRTCHVSSLSPASQGLVTILSSPSLWLASSTLFGNVWQANGDAGKGKARALVARIY